MSPLGRVATALVLLGLACLSAGPVRAARTRTWSDPPNKLEQGDAEGIAITERGKLFLAPRLERLGDDPTVGEPLHIWAMATDARGDIYLGTGPAGRIIKVSPSGKQSVFFTVDEPMVSALAFTAEGDLLAGTAPGGHVYRIGPDGSGERWCDTGERYVWSLVVSPTGEVFSGTGEQGSIFRINRSGDAELFYDTNESHIVRLHALDDGALLAGSAGSGLIYRIDREGNAVVLHDDDLPEVVALIPTADGGIVAAFLAPAPAESKRPAVRIRLPDGARVGTTGDVSGLEEDSGPMLRGEIEGLPGRADEPKVRRRGRVVRISADGEATELWSSTGDSPFCMVEDARGRLLFGAGEPARLYRLEADGDVARLATLGEAQITALARIGRSVFLSTSNAAGVYRVEDEPAGSGVFVSRTFDAAGPSRWGSIRWKLDPATGGVELYTRTGNSHQPDATWSAWSPALTDPGGSPVVNPDGRYIQWRARFAGSRGAEARLSGVTVSYEPYNRSPELRELRLVPPGPAVKGDVTLEWSEC